MILEVDILYLTTYPIGIIIIGLIMYFLGKSKGYDNGWKNGMENAERLGAFAQDMEGDQ